MIRIPQHVIRQAYQRAIRVYRGEIIAAEAIRDLNTTYQMNTNTAEHIIGNIRKLLNGELYTRTNSKSATDYYLMRILRDFGPDALGRALTAVELHIEYYESLSNTNHLGIRAIRDKYSAMLPNWLATVEDCNRELENAVSELKSLPAAERDRRIREAEKLPRRFRSTTTVFARNPAVIAEVHARASGYCEECKNYAPFIRASTRDPYLEVHHIVTLAKGGEDTPENALALCPNCHCKAHYG